MPPQHAWTLVLHCLSISSSSSSSRAPCGPGASSPQPCGPCFPELFQQLLVAQALLGHRPCLAQALQLTLCFPIAALCHPWLTMCQSQICLTLGHPSVSSAGPGCPFLPRRTGLGLGAGLQPAGSMHLGGSPFSQAGDRSSSKRWCWHTQPLLAGPFPAQQGICSPARY